MGPEGTRGDKISALLLYAVVSAAMAVSWLIIFVYLQRHPWPARIRRGRLRRAA